MPDALKSPKPAKQHKSSGSAPRPEPAQGSGHPATVKSAVGNAALAASLKRGSAAVQPGAPVVAPLAQTKPVSKRPDNDLEGVKIAGTDQLIGLFVTDQDRYTLPEPPPYKPAEYTKDWVRGEGENFIKNVIKEKLASELEAGHRTQVEQALMTVKASAGNETRKGDLRDLIHNVLRTTPGVPPLSDNEHNWLMTETGLRIVRAYTAFTQACEDVKDDIKKEIAEEAEMMSLIFEIGFGFLSPVLGAQLGKAFEKGMTKIESLAVNEGFKTTAKKILTEERAKTVVESVAKVTLKELKGQVPKVLGESEAEKFVDELASKVAEQGDKIIHEELPNQTDVGLTAIWATYAPEETSHDIYAKEISKQLEEFRESVGEIGRHTVIQYGENPYGGAIPHRSETFAAYVETGIGKKLALLISSDSGGPWFSDWIPESMAEVAKAKSRATIGDIRTFTASEIGAPNLTISEWWALTREEISRRGPAGNQLRR